MRSEIWRVIAEKIGSIEAFKSGRDMESFLMNNPAVIGCWDPDAKASCPSLVREQIFTRSGKEGKGRMDIVGVARNEEGEYELRIFGLKLGEIDVSAVE